MARKCVSCYAVPRQTMNRHSSCGIALAESRRLGCFTSLQDGLSCWRGVNIAPLIHRDARRINERKTVGLEPDSFRLQR